MRPTLLLLALLTTTAPAQWDLQDSHTSASLRGIHTVGNGVAWASGTHGTVLRTRDNGQNWQPCPIPPNAEALDFRGIQAFDQNTAIVMSSGKGDLSRLYKTTDACQTWRLIFTNPDKEGFWDAIQFDKPKRSSFFGDPSPGFGVLVGDPVEHHFAIFLSYDYGDKWERQIRESPSEEADGEAMFAASNSSLLVRGNRERTLVTGGKGGPRELWFWVGVDDSGVIDPLFVQKGARPFRLFSRGWNVNSLPLNDPTESAGAFSIGSTYQDWKEVIVGGNYARPDQRSSTSWYQGKYMRWTQSQTPPHGYRSAVAYDPTHKLWITVGPNGTDLSTDDGKNWRPLKPLATQPPDADRDWNALSFPFVVGPNGRIGRLNPTALPAK